MNTIDAIALLAAIAVLGTWLIFCLIKIGGHLFGTWEADLKKQIQRDLDEIENREPLKSAIENEHRKAMGDTQAVREEWYL